jgi:IS1 family transposase
MNCHSNMKKQIEINSAWEAEIKKLVDAVWENRHRLSLANLEMLRRLANKTKL